MQEINALPAHRPLIDHSPFLIPIRLFFMLLIPILALASPAGANAQNKTEGFKVKGKVSNAVTKAPLTGISVTLKDAKGAAFTDTEGHFDITLPGSKAILIVSAIGFETKEVPIDGQAFVEVALTPVSHDQ